MMAFVFYLFIFVCVVMLQPMEDVPVSERNKHKFMVQTMCVDDSLSPEILDEAVSKREREGGGGCRKIRIYCIFTDAQGR